MNEDKFNLVDQYKSYVAKPDITNLSPHYLVRGSKNVLVDYANRVISRAGYTLYRQENTGDSGIKSSYDWKTSTAKEFSLRVFNGKVQFDWNNTYNTLITGLPSSYLQFAKIWDNTEKIDVLLWVLGSTNTYKWSGGVSKVRLSTATSLTKQGVLSAATTIAFVAGTPGTVAATITDAANRFVDAGFESGDTLYVTGSAANSRNFTIGSVTAGIITLIMSDTLTSEVAGPVVTVHNGEPTWASSRFLTTGTRKILYNGVEYEYTGGESTDTLTGLTGFPTVAVGDAVWQTVVVLANPGAIPASFKQDLIAVQLNQLILASTKSQEVYGSANDDYTDFTLTSPRVPADPFKVTMDDYCTCIIPIDNRDQTASSLAFGAGTNAFFQLDYKLSVDQTNELVRMIKLKTAVSSGLISTSALCSIKGAVAYVSREPSVDMLSNIEMADSNSSPLSDMIQDDFDYYGSINAFRDSHLIYYRRYLLLSLPTIGVVLMYDLERKLWQPPQTIPVGRFAIIGDLLYGHSYTSNETYELFTGTDDNGAPISQVARFAYNNGGSRNVIKNMNEYWTDGYITANGVLVMTQNLGFNASVAQKVMSILGSDPTIVVPQGGSPLGDEPLGVVPLGGAVFNTFSGLVNSNALRFYQEDSMDINDYIESYVEYSMSTLGGQFAIVAHGNNQWATGTSHITHKK
mgnify:CR=1 FL=1